MGFVVINCPADGEPVYTGMKMEAGAYEDATLRGSGMVCPRCGQVHVWSKEESWLEELEIH